jgi:hypothetical protein
MARTAFTDGVVFVDFWGLTAPTGAEVDGDVALVGAGATGAFSGHDNEIAIKLGGAWSFSGPSSLGGLILWRKAGSPANRHYASPPGAPPFLLAKDVGLDVLTTRGDLIRRGASAPERVALGSAGQLLGSDGTDALWLPGMTTRGDLLTRDATTYKRLAKGSARQVASWDANDLIAANQLRFHTAHFINATATAAGARTFGIYAVTSNDPGIPVASGKTLRLWYLGLTLKTGATVGSNYDLEGCVRKKVAATDHVIATINDQSNDVNVQFSAEAADYAVGSELIAIAGPERVHLGWGVVAGSTGALAAVNHVAEAVYSIE